MEFDDTLNTNGNFTYLWQFGDGNGSNQKNASYTYNEEGTYNVTLSITSGNNCTTDNKSKPSLVIVFPTPTAEFQANPVTADMRNPTITFKNGTVGATTYSWHFGDGDSSNVLDPTHTYADTGRYRVILISTSADGCEDISELDVVIDPYYSLSVPNAFSPSSSSTGGDWRKDPDNNRVFYPYTTHPEAVSEFEMLIFNRWGELIFESTSIYDGWDGSYRGKSSPQEVYVYKIKLKWENGQSFEKMGDVTLFR